MFQNSACHGESECEERCIEKFPFIASAEFSQGSIYLGLAHGLLHKGQNPVTLYRPSPNGV